MILIVVKFTVKPERVETFRSEVDEFTQATRAEPGNIFFEWAKSLESPDTFVLTEAFQDDAAEAHVTSDHFQKVMGWMPDVIAAPPQIINAQNVPGEGWGEMAELKPS